VSTLPFNIQRSKLVEIMVVDARFGSTCKSKVFFTIVGNTSSTNTIWERNET
jgi:hypothetical protein